MPVVTLACLSLQYFTFDYKWHALCSKETLYMHLHDVNYSTIKVRLKKRLIIISLFTTNDTFIGIYSRQQRKFTARNYSLHLMITMLAMIGKSRRTKMRFWNVHTSSPVGCNWRRNYSFLYNLTYHLYSWSMYIQYR